MPFVPHLVMVPEVSHLALSEQQKPLLQSTASLPQTVWGLTERSERSRAEAERANANGTKKDVARILNVFDAADCRTVVTSAEEN